ncbi:MAG TPA: methyltransferase domain-containing protein [Gemmatimonadaceae bacterium]|nr:methyltransferase domain-containing protein [Gemmatimonadaceae bacterium]
MPSPRPERAATRGIVKSLADNSDGRSLATRLRRSRFELFLSLLSTVPGHAEILDIGGTQEFWDLMGIDELRDARVTLLNIEHQRVTSPQFVSAVGDARSMPQFADKSFDVVFSNSVIEHVGDYSAQRRMANEVMRVGRRFFVQTPNRRFPLEPHFLFPWFQYLPSSVRAQMLNRFNLGWYKRIPDLETARAEVDSIQLLTRRKFAALFPGAVVYVEKFAGLPKSFVVYGGWSL